MHVDKSTCWFIKAHVCELCACASVCHVCVCVRVCLDVCVSVCHVCVCCV